MRKRPPLMGMSGMIGRAAVAVAVLALAGGAAQARRHDTPGDWRSVATESDRARLRGWRDAWMAALTQMQGAGEGGRAAAEGLLLQPDAGQGQPAPPPGDYRCRTLKLGTHGAAAGTPSFIAYPGFACRIAQEGDALSFAKLDGSQRPAGLLFPDRGMRLVFLGTMMLGDERNAHRYGRDAERDMIGVLERIGPQRWRLVLPSPRWESLIDVIELVPAG